MKVASPKTPALPDAAIEIDFQALSDSRLAEMETAAKAVGESLAHLHRLMTQGRVRRYIDAMGVHRFQASAV